MNDLSKQIKEKLWAQFKTSSGCDIDDKGYVSEAEKNLIPGVRLADVEDDLQEGAGNELQEKFRAVHSSSALGAISKQHGSR